ncbi:MAG: hypothetical protein WCC04_02800 [Terriglobales bacterium]
MNRVFVLLLLLCLSCALTAQEPVASQISESPVKSGAAKRFGSSAAQERWFFPSKNWIYGYTEFDIAPPHNEPDPNLCAANSGNSSGENSQCSAFARYVMAGQVEIRPFGLTYLQRIRLFAMPTCLYGKTVPQHLYTWSMEPIGCERQWGASVYLGKRFDLRVTQHFRFQTIGSRYLGAGYLGPNGPWGQSTMIGVRRYFGSPSVHDEGVR